MEKIKICLGHRKSYYKFVTFVFVILQVLMVVCSRFIKGLLEMSRVDHQVQTPWLKKLFICVNYVTLRLARVSSIIVLRLFVKKIWLVLFEIIQEKNRNR